MKLYSFSQSENKVLYAKKKNTIGTTETILIPDNNKFYLKRIHNGKFPGITSDTLYQDNQFFKGKLFRVSISNKKFVLSHIEKKWKEKLKYKEYNLNDPFILDLKPKSK